MTTTFGYAISNVDVISNVSDDILSVLSTATWSVDGSIIVFKTSKLWGQLSCDAIWTTFKDWYLVHLWNWKHCLNSTVIQNVTTVQVAVTIFEMLSVQMSCTKFLKIKCFITSWFGWFDSLENTWTVMWKTLSNSPGSLPPDPLR